MFSESNIEVVFSFTMISNVEITIKKLATISKQGGNQVLWDCYNR